MAKLEILSLSEQLIFNDPPNLTREEQTQYFELPPELTTWLDNVNNITNKAGFVLLWSYCQKGMRFYQPKQFREDDLKAVCLKYNFDVNNINFKNYNQRTFNNHKQTIRKHINLTPFDREAKEFFLECIKDRVARHYWPKQILQEVLKLLQARRIEIPGYNQFALTITQAISDYDKHLIQLIEFNLSADQILEEASLLPFVDIDVLLQLLKDQLRAGYHKTNRRIKSGKNLHIKFDAKDKMVLATPKVDKLDTQSVSALFADQKYTSILKILSDIQRLTNYLDCFAHHHVKDKKVLPKTSIFYAAILGLGCNIGVNKMANVSKGITEDALANFVNWHMSINNINEANQRILDLLGQLTLATIYQKNPTELHTASDGRKVGVVVESLNANQSFKYFGSGAGSSLYSFIDELNRLFYTTSISSSEREAAYVTDGLLHNLSIKSSIHSTDTHGYSEAVFAILHMLGIYFAPRIKGLKKSTLYSFEPRKLYETKKQTSIRYYQNVTLMLM